MVLITNKSFPQLYWFVWIAICKKGSAAKVTLIYLWYKIKYMTLGKGYNQIIMQCTVVFKRAVQSLLVEA